MDTAKTKWKMANGRVPPICHLPFATRSYRRAFSLIELVIVVVIIAIIGAIAIPRLSRGVEGAGDAALISNLASLRKAIDLYQAEHGSALPTDTRIAAQLTQFSDNAGGTQTTFDSTHIYGPYLRAIPALSVGARKGSTGIAGADAPGVGWIYDMAGGNIRANTSDTSPIEADVKGKLYSSY